MSLIVMKRVGYLYISNKKLPHLRRWSFIYLFTFWFPENRIERLSYTDDQ